MPRHRTSRRSRRARKSHTNRRARKSHTGRRARRAQRGGELPSGYPGTVVSYTPHSSEIGDVDVVPRIGSKEEFEEDTRAAME